MNPSWACHILNKEMYKKKDVVYVKVAKRVDLEKFSSQDYECV